VASPGNGVLNESTRERLPPSNPMYNRQQATKLIKGVKKSDVIAPSPRDAKKNSEKIILRMTKIVVCDIKQGLEIALLRPATGMDVDEPYATCGGTQ
jgi:hypothetical protein